MTRALRRVLVVEDDRGLQKVLSRLFEGEGFRVFCAETCELAIRAMESHRADICIADLTLPDRDGFCFIRQVRVWSEVPIIVLSARADQAQRLAAFECGADDYVTKPFDTAELLARVRAVLRRFAPPRTQSILRLGAASIDLGRRVTCGPDGGERRLTPLEHRILECLLRHSGGGPVTHEQLTQEVWGPRLTDLRGLRVYITSLRRKLEVDPSRPRHILTEPGVGYRLVTELCRSTSRVSAASGAVEH